MAEVTTEANESPVEEFLHKQGVRLKKLWFFLLKKVS
jgi:hypothetical protein